MRKKTLLTRLVSGAVVVAVVAGSAFLVSNGVAGADPPPGTLGGNTIAPDPGTNIDPMSSKTGGGCPAPSTKADLKVVGPIGVDPASQVFPATSPFTFVTITDTQFSNDGAFDQKWQVTFQDAVNARRGAGTPIPTGEYDFTTRCLNRLGNQTFGTFVGGLFFDTATTYHGLPSTTPPPSSSPLPTVSPSPTPVPSVSPSPTPVPSVSPSPTPVPSVSPSPTPVPSVSPSPTPVPSVSPTPTPGPIAKATATNISVIRISFSFGLGGFVIPFANVMPRAAGTVQFKDGTTNLGRPVRVVAGFAFGGFFVLPVGTHSLTAEFTPANPGVAQPSTSNAVTFTF